MYKDLNTLLLEKKSYEERVEELLTLCPSLEDNKLIYYDKNKYIYYTDGDFYNGSDNYPHDSVIRGAFHLLFIINCFYTNKKMKEDFYEKYLKENKDYYLDENGILYLKGYGALGNNSYCNELASEFKTDEELVESILSEIKKEEV